jgi:hypothetical protein
MRSIRVLEIHIYSCRTTVDKYLSKDVGPDSSEVVAEINIVDR